VPSSFPPTPWLYFSSSAFSRTLARPLSRSFSPQHVTLPFSLRLHPPSKPRGLLFTEAVQQAFFPNPSFFFDRSSFRLRLRPCFRIFLTPILVRLFSMASTVFLTRPAVQLSTGFKGTVDWSYSLAFLPALRALRETCKGNEFLPPFPDFVTSLS